MVRSSSGRVHYIAGGALFLSIFGAVWLVLGVLFAGRASALGPLAAAVVILTGAALHLRRTTAPDAGSADSAGARRSFMQINMVQYVAVALAVLGANIAGRPDLIPLLISVIVALHFLPLAHLFRRPIYYPTTAAILLLDAYALIHAPHATAARAAIGTGLILWLTATIQLARGFALRRAVAA